MKNKYAYENFHILLWILKDICWVFEWKLAGIIMVFPTVTIALYLTFLSFKNKSNAFWINLAISFWIIANSYWMICEFIGKENIKNYASISFILGLLSISIFYYKSRKIKR